MFQYGIRRSLGEKSRKIDINCKMVPFCAILLTSKDIKLSKMIYTLYYISLTFMICFIHDLLAQLKPYLIVLDFHR